MNFKLFILVFSIVLFFQPEESEESEKIDIPETVLISGGTYQMGEANGEGDEKPVHKVTLSDFYIGKYEVTVKQYKQFCEDTKRELPKAPEWGWIDSHPIMNIIWYDAQAYIQWLNKKSGQNYRLPTEAEFEYVIRNGGKQGVYPFKKSTNDPKENVADESFSKKNPNWSRSRIWKDYTDGYAGTSPVGSFSANDLGVHDINGNAWEWVSDWYADYTDKDATNPTGPTEGKFKVGRGASYNADPWHTRSAGRNWVEPEFKKPGFRIAKDK